MPYALRITVHPSDCDELDHASNLTYLRWTLDAALEHSRALGLGTADYVARGQSFVVRRHELHYLRQAVVGDALEVETRVVRLQGASSQRQTRILRGDVLVFHARTDWAYIDLKSGRPVRIPADIRERFPVDPAVETGGS